MRFLLTVLFLFIFRIALYAQDTPEPLPRNRAIYAEFLGNGLVFSLNYDWRFERGRQDGHGMRAGLGGAPIAGRDLFGTRAEGVVIMLPVAYNYMIGKGRSAFEMGAGITPLAARVEVIEFGGDKRKNTDFAVVGVLNAGYRFQPLNKGFVFRFNWTPIISEEGFSPVWLGLSFGYGFKK